MWETIDPDGRRVVLDWAGWAHIASEHDDLVVTPEAILGIIATPDKRLPGRQIVMNWSSVGMLLCSLAVSRYNSFDDAVHLTSVSPASIRHKWPKGPLALEARAQHD